MKTRSKTLPQINWDYCNFCRQKAIKKGRKLERIASSERVKYILNAARGKFDYDLLSLLTVDDVQEKAQYHSACITNYLLKWKKEHSADNYSTFKNESEHDIAFKKFLDILHHDLFENKKAFTMSSLLDKGFIDKVFYCQITDKASKSLRRYYCDRKSKGTRSVKYSFQ
jgi:hypothetical protein